MPPADRDRCVLGPLREPIARRLDDEVRASDLGSPHAAIVTRYTRAAAKDPRSRTDWWVGAFSGAGLATLGTLAAAQLFELYGIAAFVVTPIAAGALSAWLCGLRVKQPIQRCMTASLMAQGIVFAVLLGFGIEGAICLIMAAPITAPLALIGAVFAYYFQPGGAPRPGPRGFPVILPAILLAPFAALVAEKQLALQPPLHRVVTAVGIAAPPDVVWRRVVDFPALPPATHWLFRAGVAAPRCARIDGCGVGAVRYCEFTTGPFVEPIEVWDEPRLLRFAVTSSPAPMTELSPYDVHPPHLHGFLNSRRGQFRLIALPDGGTRLEGTTWYDNRMWPQAYWRLWSDAVIHEIHRTVLRHVRDLAENDAR
ncbi:MAG: SRPBCC family protein [Phycisphaerae bacterium]